MLYSKWTNFFGTLLKCELASRHFCCEFIVDNTMMPASMVVLLLCTVASVSFMLWSTYQHKLPRCSAVILCDLIVSLCICLLLSLAMHATVAVCLWLLYCQCLGRVINGVCYLVSACLSLSLPACLSEFPHSKSKTAWAINTKLDRHTVQASCLACIDYWDQKFQVMQLLNALPE